MSARVKPRVELSTHEIHLAPEHFLGAVAGNREQIQVDCVRIARGQLGELLAQQRSLAVQRRFDTGPKLVVIAGGLQAPEVPQSGVLRAPVRTRLPVSQRTFPFEHAVREVAPVDVPIGAPQFAASLRHPALEPAFVARAVPRAQPCRSGDLAVGKLPLVDIALRVGVAAFSFGPPPAKLAHMPPAILAGVGAVAGEFASLELALVDLAGRRLEATLPLKPAMNEAAAVLAAVLVGGLALTLRLPTGEFSLVDGTVVDELAVAVEAAGLECSVVFGPVAIVVVSVALGQPVAKVPDVGGA